MFPAGYDGAMLAFWKTQLDGAFEHIVDLATGNGALVWIAHDIQSRQARPARISGVDLADIDPFTALNKSPEDYPTVSFIGNTPVDSLPFADRSVDVVISQYGIEYSNLEKTIPEIARVLTGAGKMCVILHDEESVIVRGMANKLEHCRDLLADDAFQAQTRAFIELQGSFADVDDLQKSEAYQALGTQLYRKLLQLKPRLDQYPQSSPLNAYIQSWSSFTRPSRDADISEKRRLSQTALEDLRSAAENLAEVTAAALSAADRDALAGLIRGHGLTISEFAVLEFEDGRNWGTRLVAQR